MSDIPSFPYDLLYHERVIRSVVNNTREDGKDFLKLAASIPVRTKVEVYCYRMRIAHLNLSKMRMFAALQC